MPNPSLASRVDHIARAIVVLRGQKVLLDAELAALYGVSTARLNQQVRRNRQRFPPDFAFEVSSEEFSRLMLQIATSKPRRGGRRKLPLAFTEHGALMAATVLNSRIAVEMSLYVVRAFGQLRQLLALRIESCPIGQNDFGIPSTCVPTYDKIKFVETGATW